jgi:elongation factor Ts
MNPLFLKKKSNRSIYYEIYNLTFLFMSVSLDQIKELREATGVSMMACKKALDEANGDITKAIDILRKKGEAKAVERSERSTGQGIVVSYIHSNAKLGVLVQLGCETDFVAKNEDFINTAKDIAMHVAATNPTALSAEEISDELIKKEREIWVEQLKAEGKNEQMIENILVGKEKKFREEGALMSQQFVKNPDITIDQLVKDLINKMGENIKIVRFCRYSI